MSSLFEYCRPDTVSELRTLYRQLLVQRIDFIFTTIDEPEYAIYLMETLLNTEEEIDTRQTAGVLLKKYVFNSWKQRNGVFDGPVASSVVKTRIRTMLPNGLTDASSEIRYNTALILVSIAQIDFPDDWPDMCEVIFARLQNADSNTCSGILMFINRLNLTCRFYLLNNKSDIVYPLLYEIAQNTVSYSKKNRTDAIYLFGNTSTCCTKEENTRLDRCRLFSEFCYMCKDQLVSLEYPDESDYYLNAAIIKSYMMLVSQAKENLTTTMTNILPAIWKILFRSGKIFDEMLVKETFLNCDSLETVEEVSVFYLLVYNILELLCVLLDAQLVRQEILVVLSDLLYYLVLFMGIPKDIEDRWRSDSNAYFGEEFNDKSRNISVRIKARDLLLVMTRELPAGPLLNALAMTVNKHTRMCKLKSESYYWRVMEAVMFAIGSIKTFILNRYGTDELQHFDIHGYLSQWAKEMDPCPTLFLAARIMWVGGCYALILEKNILSSYLMNTIDLLQKPSYILKFSALRAIYLHVAAITMSKHRAVYMQAIHSMTDALINAINDLEGDILYLGLFTLQLLLNVPPLCIKILQHQFITLINNIIMKNITRPAFLTDCLPIVKSLTVSVPCREALETKFLPFITNAIHETDPSVYPDVASLFEAQSIIIEILNVMVKYSPEPLNDNMFYYGFMTVCATIFSFDDLRIIQSGAHFLQSYLCKGAAQLASVTHKDGRTGADHILDVLKHVLDSNKMEFACKQVGRFFITALHMLGPQLQPHTDILLRVLVSAVQRANTHWMEESLLIIFAYLFYYHLEPALNYLTLIPGAEEQSALVFILDKWLSKSYNCGGKYSGNLNVLAYTRLIEHTLLQQDQRVADIKLADTRTSIPFAASKSETDLDSSCVEIPVVLKLITHLIYVLQHGIEVAEDGHLEIGVGSSEISLISTTPGSSSNLDSVAGVGSSEISLISTTPGSSSNPDSVAAMYEHYKQQSKMDSATDSTDDSYYCDILDIHIDHLDATNPIYNMKMRKFLKNFFKKFSENAIFMEYLQCLSNSAKNTLFLIGVNVNVEDSEDDE